MITCGVRLLLLAYLFSRIETDLCQKLMRHSEVGIDFDRPSEYLNSLGLLYLVEVQGHGLLRKPPCLGGPRYQRQDSLAPFRLLRPSTDGVHQQDDPKQ